MKRWVVLVAIFTAFVPAMRGAETSAARARAVLTEGASAKDPAVRVEVAVALSLVAGRDPAADLLSKLAQDGDHVVRESAVTSIGEMRDARFAPVAKTALSDDVPEVAFAAARALFRLKQPEGRQALIEIVEKETKAKSNFLRAKLRDTWRRMKTPKSALLFAAQQGVGFIPVPGVGEGMSALTGILSDPDFSARATTLIMLAGDRTLQVRQLVDEAFLDDDWSMRAAAVQIAAQRADRTWRPKLIPLLDDSNRKVRYRAAASLLRLERVGAPRPAGKDAPK